ncbi:hypothetical protein [Streptomyces malaysiensis]|uniref:Uncharacterized protein n=1 Tax=Streptomyces malaysiensis TaxID=92644 RepID=A0A7X5X7K4_STRMQ|nr:hypothetical protein [Streptomyces malaysiensis]NIY68100.1 hypothetical protein [Streptomyces malaysiensis]
MTTSMRELREQAVEYLGWENRDPGRYNIDGIVRDAWVNGNGSDKTWKAAVEKHYRRFMVGDWVRIAVEVEDGFTEHHYGQIENFRKPDGNFYRRNVTHPYAAFVHPEYTRSHVVPLADLVEEINDFEIVTDFSRVHEGGPQHNYGVYHCMGGHGPYPPPATVMVIHKGSGQVRRFCDSCNTAEYRTGLADEVLMYQRNLKQTILELRADPALITGPTANALEVWDKSPADQYRDFADTFAWLVPAPAAELYKQWKEQQRAGAA